MNGLNNGAPTIQGRAQQIKNILINVATGGNYEENELYEDLRLELVQHPNLKKSLPGFLLECRDLPQFWAYIQSEFPRYKERRQHIWQGMSDLFNLLEQEPPLLKIYTENAFTTLSSEIVQQQWESALARQTNDPSGAITMARTLLESVIKHILDDSQTHYEDSDDLPKLYKSAADKLNLAPSQHTELAFKQILSGCVSVVQGLGTVRNKIGDSHGQGRTRFIPAERHANLAVNLAGSMSIFLITTWEHNRTLPTRNDPKDN